ncbi:MAG: hypothetical protein ACTSU5_09795 [Promethearchaeota archaeon]
MCEEKMGWLAEVERSLKQTFTRDLELNRRAIVYLILVMTGIIFNAVFLINQVYMDEGSESQLKTITIVTVGLGVVFSGIITDKSQDKVHLTFVCFSVSAFGLFLLPFNEFYLQSIGIILTGFTTAVIFCTWISVIIHETTSLNRGRISGIVIVFGALIGLIVLVFTNNKEVERWAFVPNLLTAIVLYLYSFEYFVFDSQELTRTNLKFRDVAFDYNIIGYSLAEGFIAFALGVLFQAFHVEQMLIPYIVAILVVTTVAGILIDNAGRKYTFVICSVVFLALLIFIEMDEPNVFATIYGAMSAILIILVISVSGDLTVEKARAFRSRIVSVFFISLLVGFSVGYLVGSIFAADPSLEGLSYKLGLFFLILEIVTIMPLRESLTWKETEWYKHLRQMYVFHTSSGICLFDYDFTKDHPQRFGAGPSKDLISGGLTGIVALISEITQSKTQLQVVDHGDSKIIFNYGKFTTIALITSRFLRTFVQKLKSFGKEFEDIFDELLVDFRGDVTIFDSAEYLVDRFFQQKYLSLKDFYQ